MSDSMFGRPLQHLLPSNPPARAEGGSVASHPQTAPVKFTDFRFSSIGKQPELLSRISLTQPDHTDYHSSTPSPASTPPPTFTDSGTFQYKSSSRPTLYQQLAGGISNSMDGGLRWHAPTNQPNRSLASRIQMTDIPSNGVANTLHSTASRLPTPPSRVNNVRHTTGYASLIPPVEVLPQPRSPPFTPASLAPTLETSDGHSPTSSTPFMNMTMFRTSHIPTPTIVTSNVASREPTQPSSSPVVADAMMQDLQPSPSAATATDSLAVRQERLQAISANLANLASPLPPSSSHSSPDPSASRANDNITPHPPSESLDSSIAIILRHPYSATRASGRAGLSFNDITMNMNDSSLALAPSPTGHPQDHQVQRRAVTEAVLNLNSALNAVHRAQIDNENALALQIRVFAEQCAAFERTKRAEEAKLHQEHQELQQKREELSAREASLASLEQESKAREVARKVKLTRWQAQEEEKTATEAKRMQEVQEQIAAAMSELKEIEAIREKGQLESLTSVALAGDLPTKPQESMDEEEKAVIKTRNDHLRAIKHLRRMHSDKMQKLDESNCTLRRMEEERKLKEAEEADRRRIAEEECVRARIEAEQARQILDEKWRQLVAERKRQDENDCEQARLLIEPQAHAKAQDHGLTRTGMLDGQIFERRNHAERVSASTPKANSHSLEVTTTKSVDKDGSTPAVSLSGVHTSPGNSQSTTSKRKDGLISGDAMPIIRTPNASGGDLPLKPLTKPLSSSDRMTENALKPARTPPVILSAEGGHKPPFCAQFASEPNRTVDANIRLTPDQGPRFLRTPKSQTVLGATDRGSEELNIGPVTSLSPAQRNVNLRHLKRYRNRIEENDSGDRSIRNHVKSEENSIVFLKREEHDDDQSREPVQVSPPADPLASLPPRPVVIPPPRPLRRRAAPALQTDLSSPYPPESSELPTSKREAEVTTDELRRQTLSRGSPSSQTVNASVQLPALTGTTNSLLLSPVCSELQSTESRINAGERPTQDSVEKRDTIPSESASATLSRELHGEDSSRSNRRFTNERHRSRNENGSHSPPDHYPPPSRPVAAQSPTQSHRLITSWHPQDPSNAPRAETMRASSPTTGRKRPSEFNDDDHDHRARRQRGDVWIAQDHDRDRVDSYRPHYDRRLDSESDERWTAYRALPSLPDRIRSYPLDIPRATHDNRTYTSPLSEEPTDVATHWEQPYRRLENNDTYPWYQPSAVGYSTMADHHTDDARVDQTYEPMVEERMNDQPDPVLLARMRNTQRFPPLTNHRGRGRDEPSRGRGDFGRGRGRGVARVQGPGLLERLKPAPAPPSLEDRLT